MADVGVPRETARARLKRRVLRRISPRIFWSLESFSENRAFWSTVKVKDPILFDRRSQELAERVLPFVKEDSAILDIGCGIGRPQRYLAPYVGHIVGADIARRMLSLARSRHGDLTNVSWRLINGKDFRFATDATFDFAYSEHVFQHVDKYVVIQLWCDLYRVLKPDGRALLQLLNLECLHNRRALVATARTSGLTPGDVRYWTVSEAVAIAEEVGFDVESAAIESDYRGSNGEIVDDASHAGYSIWLTLRKAAQGAGAP